MSVNPDVVNDPIGDVMRKASVMELSITPIMQKAVNSLKRPKEVYLAGLPFRLKGRTSFESKTLARSADDVRDAVRYTAIVRDALFAQDVAEIKKFL